MCGCVKLSLEIWADLCLAERYFELLKDAKIKGYLFAQQNYLDDPYKKQ